MKIAGIVAEYNPFHTGHAYQIACTRAQLGEDCAVAAVMSGHWVQGGRPAIADKWTRTKLALLGGADLVLELPTVWAVSSAETFARGAVELLAAAQVVDVLSFGSECGDADKLRRAAICLNSPEYEAGLRRLVDGGTPFAAARQRAVEGLLGPELAELLSTPNNNLGVEYIRALDRLNRDIRPMTIRREGAPHDSLLRGDGAAPVLLRHPAARLSGAGGLGGPGALPPPKRAGSAARRLERLPQPGAGGAGPAGPPAHHDGGGLGPHPGQRRRRGPAAPAGAGGKAVPLSGGVYRPGQAQALDPGPHAAAAGVGLAGPHPGGPA